MVHPQYEPLLSGTTLDFVELSPGEFSFIFLNPNDPGQTRPGSDSCGSGGCGSGGCGGGGCGSH